MATGLLTFLLIFFFSYQTSESHRLLRSHSSLPKEACSSHGFNHSGLVVHHRHGPCSSLGGQKLSPIDILRRDQYRVDSLRSRILDNHRSPIQAGDSTVPAHPGNSYETGNYIVTVGFGTPKKDMTIAFDTGSDLTWIQCEPCNANDCYTQKDPIFNPADSSSYTGIGCRSSECYQLSSGQCFELGSSEPSCQYTVTYGDRSTTRGSYARDTLSLTSSDVIPKFLFGCGHENSGLFGGTAGLMGLGRRQESLVQQTENKFGGIFSYCLPSSEGAAGFLTFGTDNQPAGTRYTPLKQHSQRPTFYFVGLSGISVDGETIPVEASGGTIVDSGTVITRLADTTYNALASAIQKVMPDTVEPPQGTGPLSPCYELSSTSKMAKVTLHLDGLDLDLDESGLFYRVSDTVSCLAFLGGSDHLTILGNTQQRKFGVVYDVPGNKLGFSPGACS